MSRSWRTISRKSRTRSTSVVGRAIGRQNITFSLLVLAALIPGAVLGLLSVVLAVIAREATELLAVAIGLRAARVTRTKDDR